MQIGLLKEFWDFLRVRKKWWLLPIIVLLALLALLVILTSNPAISPFVYTLF